jgi:predicted ribosome quality control (RQC) complex YloA/Tae2 family protein
MEIQKPTVLDAARMAAELDRLRGAVVSEAFTNNACDTLFLRLGGSHPVLTYSVERRCAYIGEIDIISDEATKRVPALGGLRITGASQINLDRIVEMRLEKEDRLGRSRNSRLIFEIMPSKGNAILADDAGIIKWSLKKTDGTEYAPPSALRKPTVLRFDTNQLIAALDKPSDITGHIYGLNERDVKTLALDTIESVAAASEALRAHVNSALRPGPGWIIYKGADLAGYSLIRPAIDADESATRVESALKMYELYYGWITGQVEEKNRLELFVRILEKEIARQTAKLVEIDRAMEAAFESRRFRTIGELLLANIHKIEKGARVARLRNLEGTEREQHDIELNPAKSVAANANVYFKRYKKGLSILKAQQRRRESVKEKLAALERVFDKAGNDMEALRMELENLGLMPRSTVMAGKRTVQRRSPYRVFKTSGGWDVWVGKSNIDNDELTFKKANKDDYWFHAWQAAGSHTVLHLPDRKAVPDRRTLLEAAALAAHFSKARTSSKVPIIYTRVKNVRKPRRFPPGKVVVEKEKQLMVRPAKMGEAAINS